MKSMSDPRESLYRETMRTACAAGAAALDAGGTAVDAVVAVNVVMEDSGVFNAGLGSCLTTGGAIEMDAAVMDGRDRGFGGVAAVGGVANPVLLARHVMEDTPHCLFGGPGATELARQFKLPFRDDFPSAMRIAEWERRKAELDKTSGSLADRLAALGGVLGEASADDSSDAPVGRKDTVGAVAMDADGHLAAAVSTGGLWMKMPGRIGDSPLPGAGLWAVDGLGVACATGTGETIMRVLLCQVVVDAIAEQGVTGASEAGVALVEQHFGVGMAGVITLGPTGEPGFHFHTRGMGRALWRGGMDEPAVGVWPGEEWDRAVPR